MGRVKTAIANALYAAPDWLWMRLTTPVRFWVLMTATSWQDDYPDSYGGTE